MSTAVRGSAWTRGRVYPSSTPEELERQHAVARANFLRRLEAEDERRAKAHANAVASSKHRCFGNYADGRSQQDRWDHMWGHR